MGFVPACQGLRGTPRLLSVALTSVLSASCRASTHTELAPPVLREVRTAVVGFRPARALPIVAPYKTFAVGGVVEVRGIVVRESGDSITIDLDALEVASGRQPRLPAGAFATIVLEPGTEIRYGIAERDILEEPLGPPPMGKRHVVGGLLLLAATVAIVALIVGMFESLPIA